MKIIIPAYDFNIRHQDGQARVYDGIRKKFVAFTPEEWVRQHWLRFLVEEKNYPRSLIAVEYSLKVNHLSRRCDIAVFGRNGKPQLIVECKAASVKLTQKVFDQIARYNLALKVRYLVVSNGKQSFCCIIHSEQGTYDFLEDLPSRDEFI